MVRQATVADLKGELADLTDEAKALSKKIDAGTATEEERGRWVSLMDDDSGEFHAKYRELLEAKKFEGHCKKLTTADLIRGEGPIDNPLAGTEYDPRSSHMAAHHDLKFRCAQTGRIVEAYSSNEKLTDKTGRAPASIGAAIHAKITGRFDYAEPQAVNALVGGSDADGGFLIQPQYGAEVIDLARAASTVIPAGAATVPMNSAELILARLDSDPTGHWRAESVEVPSTDIQFGKIVLRPKTLAAIVPVSLELMEDSSNAAMIIEQALMAALGSQLDYAALRGAGSENEPKGIINHSINEVGSISTPSDYSDVTSAVGDILQANYTGEPSNLSWIQHPRDAETYDGLTDTTGQPLQPTPWANSLKKFTTTQLPSTDGGSNNQSTAVIGDFSQCIIGMRTSGIMIRILESGSVTDSSGTEYNAASQLMRLIVAHVRADVALLRPTWFTKLTGITNT